MSNNTATRNHLPNRRGAFALTFTHAGMSYRAHVGFFPDGRIAEVFLDSSKPNSALDAFSADAAILISLLLQRNATVAEIGHALRQTPAGEPASLIGAAIAALAGLETENKDRVA